MPMQLYKQCNFPVHMNFTYTVQRHISMSKLEIYILTFNNCLIVNIWDELHLTCDKLFNIHCLERDSVVTIYTSFFYCEFSEY